MRAGREVEVAVVGGGPSGATTALRLASLGHEVLLLDEPRTAAPRMSESLPGSIWPLLDSLALSEAVQAAGFPQASRTKLRWDGAEEVVEELRQPGLHVDRERFDALLRHAALERGALLMRPARASAARPTATGWLLSVSDASGIWPLRARWLVDASGGRGGVVLRGGADRSAPRTAALISHWDDVDCGLLTRVEAGEDGWAWAAPHPQGGMNCAVFLDAGRCASLGRAGREALCRSWLQRSSMLGVLLSGRLRGAPGVRDASVWSHPDPVGARCLRVGDAAGRIDPLSSQGVQAGLHMACAAAAVVHTALVYPEREALAAQFYRERQREHTERHSRMARAYYRRTSAWRSPFWRMRAAADGVPAFTPPAQLDVPVPRDGTRLRLADGVGLERVPVLEGAEIVSADALKHPALERPLAYLGGRAIVPWLKVLDGEDPHIAVQRFEPHAPALWCWAAADWLWRRRLLVPAST